MRLTILGTGSARPVGDSAQSGMLVQSGDTSILFDIGSGIAAQVEARIGATNLAGAVHRTLPRRPLDRHRADALPLPVGRGRAAEAAGLPAAGRPREARPPCRRDQRAARLLRAGVRHHGVRDRPALRGRRDSRSSRTRSATTCRPGRWTSPGPPGSGSSTRATWARRRWSSTSPAAPRCSSSRRRSRTARPTTPGAATSTRPRRSTTSRGQASSRALLVHYWSERRDIISDLCAASGVPVEPAVTGMVVDVEPGVVHVDAPPMPAWFPPAQPSAAAPVQAAEVLD